HLKDEIYFSNGVAYWDGPFNINGTNVEAAEVKSTASGRNIANPNSLGIISVGQAISVDGSVDNKGTIVAESYSQNIVNKISEADRILQQRPESVTTSLNNGLGEDTLQAAPGEKSDAINLLPFVFAGLDPNLL